MGKDKEMTIITALLVAIAILTGFGAYHITKQPDSPAEEFAEEFIEYQTGFDVDFSPDLGLPRA